MEDNFLYYLKRALFLSGLLPDDMLTCNKTWYSLFKNVTQAVFILLNLLMYIELPYIWNDINEVIDSVNIIISYSVMVIKMYICRGRNFATLIIEMIDTEKKIVASGDHSILNIYKRYTRRGKYIQLYNFYFNLAACLLVAVPYFYKYIIAHHYMEPNVNEERKLTYHLWLPFDESSHYVAAFAVNWLFMMLAAMYYFSAPGIILTLVLFISFKLEVLSHILKNIKLYVKEVEVDNEEDNKTNLEMVFKLCVLEHIGIIKFAKTLNYCISGVTLLEFVLLSAQIALILFEGFTSHATNIIILSIIHVTMLLVQMLLFYWHADEIRNKSVAISDALYETDWYEYDKNINKTIQIMMVRSQKPITLKVGPFGEMSLTTGLKILKGVYTYATFLQHSYGNASE